MNNKTIAMYPHPGSMNHGCEAIVKATKQILFKNTLRLFTYNAESDCQYGVDKYVELVQTNELRRITLRNAWYYVLRKITGNRNVYYRYRYKPLLGDESEIVLSIGGDNYCYGVPYDILYVNRQLKKKGKKLVLWGCSVDEDITRHPAVIEDLKGYDLIVARESITYNILKTVGVKSVILCADPAFLLPKKEILLPEWFIENNTVGINISPMVLRYEKTKGIVLKNYLCLIDYIIEHTEYNVALIPHVTGYMNDDNEVINILCKKYEKTSRIGKINVASCTELKSVISKCRFFLGARTHSTIAAYSCCVPTLVVGYSVKALGIAQDLFGDSKHYVLSAQEFENTYDLLQEFCWVKDREREIRTHLQMIMPEYIQSAYKAGQYLERLY